MRFDKSMVDDQRSPRCSGVLVTVTTHSEDAAEKSARLALPTCYKSPLSTTNGGWASRSDQSRPSKPSSAPEDWYCSCTGVSEWRDNPKDKGGNGKKGGSAPQRSPVCHLGLFHTAVTGPAPAPDRTAGRWCHVLPPPTRGLR